MKMNTASSSGSGTLPSNTITNPKEDLKVENELEVTKDTVHPTNNESTKDIQPQVVQSQSPILTSDLVSSPTIEPVSSLVSAPRPNLRPSIPFPSRMQDQKLRDKANDQRDKFFQIFKDLNFNISFTDALILMPKFGPSIKSLLTNKDKLSELNRTPLNEHCSTVLLKKLREKLGDPGKFLIPCDFPGKAECLALADLGACINLMPLSVWNKLSLLDLPPTCMTLELADRSISHPFGVAEDVYVKVGTFHFPSDFVVVDFDGDPRVPLILGRFFLKTERALIDVFEGELTLRFGKEAITFNLNQTSRYLSNYNEMTAKQIDVIDKACEEYSQEVLGELTLRFGKEAITFNLNQTSRYLSNYNEMTAKQIDVIDKACEEYSQEVLGGFTVVENEDNELILTHLVTGWRCIDYRKLNKATRKDHFPLPFMDQMLERLTGNQYYCFLDGFSGYFQISIEPKDQEKTTFTCPYETFAYRRIPFGLCNAPGTFQSYLSHLERMLKRCEDTNLCLNWEKSQFMVKEGIVLDHKISKQGIEVDKAKVDVITKLPHPTTVKGIQIFLGHAGFYRRKLSEAPILIAPDWDMPFELMCDANDFAIGAVLGQCQDKHFRPIHYASKTMTEAESNYTTTEKEMLAMVYAFEKFWSYLIMNKSIVYTDHSALKYLFAKKDSKARLIRWVLLLYEFTFMVIDTKGAENLADVHLFRLNNATQKDHIPLPFIDQMLERLAGHKYYCFLDGFSGENVEECEETNLVLNWEKCHFMVKEVIVLGHKVSRSGIKDMTTKFGKLDKFEGNDFRSWQKKMHFLLTTLKVVYVLSTHMPEFVEDEPLEQTRKRCKSVMEQYHELLRILRQLTQHALNIDESIYVSSIIDKLSPSWKDFKHTMKHNKDELSLVQLGSQFRIKETLRAKESGKGKGKEIAGSSSVNMIEDGKNKKTTKIPKERKGIMMYLRILTHHKDDAFALWIDSGATCHAFQVDKTKEFMLSNFSIKDMGEADVILGIRIKREDNGITITQSYYIEKILKKFKCDDCCPVSTPLDPTIKLMPNTGRVVDQLEYSRAIGCLMYAMTSTRPDIACVVGKLSRYTSNPSTHHWHAIMRVFKYLKITMDYVLSYVGFPLVLEGYSDASWITNLEDHTSTAGWVFWLGGGAIS
nr:reverse transcriptase domain-containing protein [Tanacetum cinerariifolium]